MLDTIRHECGSKAHLVGNLVLGWNLYCCNRCGETFYRWVTKEMIERGKK